MPEETDNANDPISSLELCQFIRNSSSYHLLLKHWSELACHLELSVEAVIDLEARVNRNDHGIWQNLLFLILQKFTEQSGSKATIQKLTKALEESGLISVAEEVYNKFVKDSTATLIIIGRHSIPNSGGISHRFRIKDPTPLFTGRVKELEKLNEIISTAKTAVISGLGGIGKTELVKQYIKLNTSKFTNIIWLNAEGTQSLTEGFRTLAKDKLQISTINANGAEKDIKSVVEDCYSNLSNSKSLFIFDNAEKDKYLDIFLPTMATSDMHQVLMTSRSSRLCSPENTLELSVFTLDEGISFIKTALGIQNDSQNDQIISLLERLQFFPLALQQAVSFIKMEQRKEDDYNIKDYILEFEEAKEDLLDSEVSEDIRNEYTLTTSKTWKMTIDKISEDKKYGKPAIKILNIMAFLSPTRIPREIFFKMDEGQSDREVKNAIDLLVGYSMITSEKKQSILSIHRLVQEVIQLDLEQSKKYISVLREALVMSQKHLSNENVEHAMHAWEKAIKEALLVTEFQDLPEKILDTLTTNVRYNEAVTFGTNTLPVFDKTFGKDSETSLKLLRLLAWVFHAFGKYTDSIELYKGLIEKTRLALGELHPLSIQAYYEYGFTLYRFNKFKEAYDILKNAYEKRKQVLGEFHPDTIRSLVLVAAAMSELSMFDEALKSYKKALADYKSLKLEENDTRLLAVKHNMAILQADMGNIDESIEILQEVISQQPKSSDPSIANSNILLTYNLGLFLNQRGRHKEALEILSEAYEKWRSSLGEDHQRILAVRINIGVATCSLGDPQKALEIHKEVYEKLEKTLGSTNVYTLVAKRWIGVDLSFIGQFEDAVEKVRETVEEQGKACDDNSVDLLESKYVYAGVLERAKKYQEALNEFKRVMEGFRNGVNKTHFRIWDCELAINRINSIVNKE